MPRYFITSALPYINGVKHLGNLAGSMLPADVHARFRRMQGHEVLFICGTDEHGTPAELAAASSGVTPREYCDSQYLIQRDLYERYDLSFDWFGRSSGSENADLTQQMCEALEARGFIQSRASAQIYSNADGRFLPDRYIEGTCPNCAYPSARGDQCDKCGAILDPITLIAPRSKISGSQDLEIRDTQHLYLLLSKLEPQISTWISTRNEWSTLARSIARKWLDEGLQDRPITRDLSWGVPVTQNGRIRPGFETKVFYVWFDAPIAYIAITQEWAKQMDADWQRWWLVDKGADDTTYVQFMGQDNVAFHAITFSGTLIGSGRNWKTADKLKAFNWVNWYGEKFSTSNHLGVFMDQALLVRSSDYWRWCLMANSPESGDVSFTWEMFEKSTNADLANILGNFVNRVLQFCKSKFNGLVPSPSEPFDLEVATLAQINSRLAALTIAHESIEFRKAAVETRALWIIGNEYLQTAKPWSSIKDDLDAAKRSIWFALNLCALFAIVASPFMPQFARLLLERLGHKNLPIWPSVLTIESMSMIAPGQRIDDMGICFEKITSEELNELNRSYPPNGLAP